MTRYRDGVFGAIKINGPASAPYDIDLETVFLSDWSHDTVDTLYDAASSSVGTPYPMNNGLINGKNVNKATGSGSRYEMKFTAGKYHRIRFINSAIDTMFQVALDEHEMTVIAADFVPIKPFNTETLTIASGQRYDVIIHADRSIGNYWLRAIPLPSCSNNDQPDNIRAIIRYDTSSKLDPTSN